MRRDSAVGGVVNVDTHRRLPGLLRHYTPMNGAMRANMRSWDDHPLAGGAVVSGGQRLREVLEPDRAGRQRTPVEDAFREQRERAVDLVARVVEGAAEVELVVVQRAGGEHG